MDIHATIGNTRLTTDMGNLSDIVPGYVTNHGILNSTQLKLVLQVRLGLYCGYVEIRRLLWVCGDYCRRLLITVGMCRRILWEEITVCVGDYYGYVYV